MTEQIKCPCCGSYDVEDFDYYNGDDKRCSSCECQWHESKRQPPEITPDMAWDWFCKRLFKQYACLADIVVDECGYLYFVWSDGNIELGLDHCMIETLGWVDMPLMTRKDVVND